MARRTASFAQQPKNTAHATQEAIKVALGIITTTVLVGERLVCVLRLCCASFLLKLLRAPSAIEPFLESSQLATRMGGQDCFYPFQGGGKVCARAITIKDKKTKMQF